MIESAERATTFQSVGVRAERQSWLLLSGLRLLEKFAWISRVVRASDWLLIEAIKRIPVDKAIGRSKEWATMQCVTSQRSWSSRPRRREVPACLWSFRSW